LSRRIQTAPTTNADPGALLLGVPEETPKKPDDYLDRLLKYIPAEIIALYLAVTNAVPSTDRSYHLTLWIVFAVTVASTPIYMYFATQNRPAEPVLWSQIVISSVAFPIWVFAIGGPFRYLPWYEAKHWIAAVVISFVTFFAALYKPQHTPNPR
jgi:hypothetical protein